MLVWAKIKLLISYFIFSHLLVTELNITRWSIDKLKGLIHFKGTLAPTNFWPISQFYQLQQMRMSQNTFGYTSGYQNTGVDRHPDEGFSIVNDWTQMLCWVSHHIINMLVITCIRHGQYWLFSCHTTVTAVKWESRRLLKSCKHPDICLTQVESLSIS